MPSFSGFGRIGLQFTGWQIFDAAQAKDPKEVPAGDVDIRPAEFLAAAANRNQVAVQQLAEHLFRADPPDGLNFGTRHRLAIGDDGECLEGGIRKPVFCRIFERSSHPGAKLGAGEELEASGKVFDAEGRSGSVEQAIEFPQQCPAPGGIG